MTGSNLSNDLTLLSPSTRAVLDRGCDLFIGNQWQAPADGRHIPVIDPSSAQVVSQIAAGSSADIERAVAAAEYALRDPAWCDLAPGAREQLLRRLADLIESDAQRLAEVETVDAGMPLWMSRNLTVPGVLDILRYMGGWSSKIAGQTVDIRIPIPGSRFFGYTRREPVGVVAAIIPWNVPLMLAIWKLAPALAAGCTIVLKPAEHASLSVLLLGELAARAGFPPGVVNVVSGLGSEAGEALLKHPGVSKVTFTGSTATGRHVAQQAAQHLKRATVELGGKSPQLVFADADLDRAIPAIANSIFLHSGQICVAGSRLYVQDTVYNQTLERLGSYVQTLVVGAGLSPQTRMGPLISARQQERVLEYIDAAVAQGARLVSGSPRVDSAGFYVRPTLISDARQDMEIVQQEVFGPVLTIMPFHDLDEAVDLANGTVYGLAASVWSSTLTTIHRIVPRLRSGKVTVNTDSIPHPALPEGGVKDSGYGRDLGEEAIASFLETKAVLIRYD
jgi:phenylacetaldehyde dehydrogenase